MSRRATIQVRALVNNHWIAYFLYHIHYLTSFHFLKFDSNLQFFSLCNLFCLGLITHVFACIIWLGSTFYLFALLHSLSYPVLSCPTLSSP